MNAAQNPVKLPVLLAGTLLFGATLGAFGWTVFFGPQHTAPEDHAVNSHTPPLEERRTEAYSALARLQNCVDLFSAEHSGEHVWSLGVRGMPTSVTVAKALLHETESNGLVADDEGETYGPYLRSLPVNPMLGENFFAIAVNGVCTAAAEADGVGQTWSSSECGWNLNVRSITVSEVR